VTFFHLEGYIMGSNGSEMPFDDIFKTKEANKTYDSDKK
jgi:hypothetical protein